MKYTIKQMQKIMWDGYVLVGCPICDFAATIEPDAEVPCPECGAGNLVSPLISEGLI